METKANFALIGAFVIAAVVAFAGFTLWLGQSQFQRDFDVYEIVFEGPVTLESGASVRFNGINVGEVTRVAIDRGNDRMVRTRIRVNSDTPVRTDSVAAIDFAGITGLTFVQIRAGSPSAPLLERQAGERVPEIKSELNPLAELFAGGAKILETANSGLENVSGVLSDDNVSSFSNLLSNLESFSAAIAGDDNLTGDVAGTLASARAAADAIAEAGTAVAELSEHADANLAVLSGDIQSVLAEMQVTMARANTVLDAATGTVEAAETTLEGPAVETMESISLATQDFQILMARLDNLVRELEQNPQALISGNPQPYEGGRQR